MLLYNTIFAVYGKKGKTVVALLEYFVFEIGESYVYINVVL